MDLTITGRHVDVTEPMEKHIRAHAGKLSRYDSKIQYLAVTLALDSGAHLVEIVAKCHRANLVAQSRGHDMYRCIDEAFEKVQRQVVRLHDKLIRKPGKAVQKGSEGGQTAS